MSQAATSALALVAMGLAIVAIALATVANRRWAQRPVRGSGPRPNRTVDLDGQTPQQDGAPDLRAGPSGGPDPEGGPAVHREGAAREGLAAVLASLRDQVDDLSTRLEDLGGQSATVRSDVEALRAQVQVLTERADEARDPTALRHVALVRYDAFADVGGRLSYSVALLDDTSSGLVLTTLAGKADVRTYVRTISAGASDGSLTAEEQQAIDAAVGSRQ